MLILIKELGSGLIITAVVVLESSLSTHCTRLNAHGTGSDPPSVALDTVTVFECLLTAQLAFLAFLAQQTCHGRNGLDEHVTSALTRHLLLLNTVECAFIHDNDTSAAYDLNV